MYEILETLLRPNPLTGWYDLPLSLHISSEKEWAIVDASRTLEIRPVGECTVEAGLSLFPVGAEMMAELSQVVCIMQDHVPGRVIVKGKESALWYTVRIAVDGFKSEFLEEFAGHLDMLTETEGPEQEEAGVVDLDTIENQLSE